jgi:excisionase family DNA binding protein
VSASRWLTVSQAADHAGVSERLLYRACSAGLLRHCRIGAGRSIRLTTEWVDDYLEASARGGTVREAGEREPRSSELAPLAS